MLDTFGLGFFSKSILQSSGLGVLKPLGSIIDIHELSDAIEISESLAQLKQLIDAIEARAHDGSWSLEQFESL